MTFNPSRRFLALPAWAWLLFTPLLVLLAYVLGAPGAMSDPQEMARLLQPLLLVAREGDSFRFIPFEDRQKITPHWAISYIQTATNSRDWSWGPGAYGFWKRTGTWRYSLEALRFDTEWNPKTEPMSLPPADTARLRPMLIQELDRCSPDEHRGDRLVELLDKGIDRSSHLSVQNSVILLAWLSLTVALLNIVAMFIEPGKRTTEDPLPGATP